MERLRGYEANHVWTKYALSLFFCALFGASNLFLPIASVQAKPPDSIERLRMSVKVGRQSKGN